MTSFNFRLNLYLSAMKRFLNNYTLIIILCEIILILIWLGSVKVYNHFSDGGKIKSQDTIKLLKSKKIISPYDTIYFNIYSTDGKVLKGVKIPVPSDSKEYHQFADKYYGRIKGYPTSDTIWGDFNGDGKKEKIWHEQYTIKSIEIEQMLEYLHTDFCDSGKICCSDKKIKPLIIDYLVKCKLIKNEGDLDGDGADEIGILQAAASNCENYLVYSYKNNKWQLLFNINNTLNMREAGVVLIEKDSLKKGYIKTRESIVFFDLDKIKSYNLNCSCGNSDVFEISYKIKK